MTIQYDVDSTGEGLNEGFDLSPNEEQALAIEMVNRFSKKHLNFDNPDEKFDKISREFDKLGIGDLIGEFSDPVLIALLCERLGYHGVLTALRLVLPYLNTSSGSMNSTEHSVTSNIALMRIHAKQTDFVGIAFDSDAPLNLFSDQYTLHQVQFSDLPSCGLKQLDLGVSQCAIVSGIIECGTLRSTQKPNQEDFEFPQKLAFILVSLLVGSISRSVDFGFEYAQERNAFGKAILNHQPVSFRLVDGLMQAEALHLLLLSEATYFQRSKGLKGLAEEVISASSTVLRDILQNCGGHGYVSGIEINTLFATSSVCRALLSSLTHSFLLHSNQEEN
ncbi:MAG: acyl-CoA/acyl-ACP dehydrogenase [Alphaproteobacteria bacterium]|nr:acyl-CoA/acyl-ACP dehydrogenase [Alphaproteobacteria bacterium]